MFPSSFLTDLTINFSLFMQRQSQEILIGEKSSSCSLETNSTSEDSVLMKTLPTLVPRTIGLYPSDVNSISLGSSSLELEMIN